LKKILYIFILFLFSENSNAQISRNYIENTFKFLHLNEKGLLSENIKSKYNLKKKIEKDVKDYAYEAETNWLEGLYLKANTAYDLQNDDPAYDVRLELDFYDQGYYQYKKKEKKDFLDGKILFYRTLQSIEFLQKESELTKIQKYTNALDVSILLLQLKFYDLSFQEAKNRFALGLITKNEYEKHRFDIQKIKDDLSYFRHMVLLKIPANIWDLLNNIERVNLVDEKELSALLEKKSLRSKLTKVLQEKRLEGEDWRDKLRLNLYAGTRKMYLSQEQTLVGIEAKIPLSGFEKQDEAQRLEIALLDKQLLLQEKNDRELLSNKARTFLYKQNKIKTYSYELTRLKQHIHEIETVNNSAYGSYKKNDFRGVEDLMQIYIQKYTFLQKERLNTYKELIDIVYLVHEKSLVNILQ